MNKIMILTNYANGLYLFRKELLEAFTDCRYRVVVGVPEDENCRKLQMLGAKIIDTKLERRGSNPFKDFKLFLRYMMILKKERPDVVLTYTIKPNIYGGLACRLSRIPYLVNVTGLGTALENPGMLGKILVKLYRIATKNAVCIYFQNKQNQQFMQENGICGQKQTLLPGSGVNLLEHPFSPYPSEKSGIIFLAVIRIMKDKGIEEYLNAAEKIKADYPNTSFRLVGEYEEETRGYYEPWIEKLQSMGIIQYYGHIDNVAEVMAESHIIVHPSYHEGMSNVLLEAAACGRPVLSSDVPGCIETLEPGLSGLAFQSQNTESLVRTIQTILSYSESDREEMGKEGRSFIETHFDRKQVIQAYIDQIQGRSE